MIGQNIPTENKLPMQMILRKAERHPESSEFTNTEFYFSEEYGYRCEIYITGNLGHQTYATHQFIYYKIFFRVVETSIKLLELLKFLKMYWS